MENSRYQPQEVSSAIFFHKLQQLDLNAGRVAAELVPLCCAAV